jgi:hypothetical protein
MRVRGWQAPLAGWIALAALVGCTGGKDAGSYATVSGVVTNNGAPVDGAKVNFYSTVEAAGKGSASYSVMTDSFGKYLIATVGKEPGIPPGMYKVTITKLDGNSAKLPPDFDQGQLEASGMAKNMMPKDYENVNTTKLSVTLEPGKNENKNFDLKGKASNARAATP